MSAKQNRAKSMKTQDYGEMRGIDSNPPMPDELIEKLAGRFGEIRKILEDYAVHLRALDRKRLLGIGIKTQGFIKRIHMMAETNPQFLPYYLSSEKLSRDYAYYSGFLSLYEDSKQIDELLWNITILSGHVSKTNALGYYAMLREAAKRRVDPAEGLYKEMEVFFKKHRKSSGQPTEKELKRDVNALLHGKRDGQIVIKNVSPKVTAGRREVVDESYDDNARIKKIEEEND
jgi:hypothetical protein